MYLTANGYQSRSSSNVAYLLSILPGLATFIIYIFNRIQNERSEMGIETRKSIAIDALLYTTLVNCIMLLTSVLFGLAITM